jgi:glycosyltransferase involved in cell wall biosynthesis
MDYLFAADWLIHPSISESSCVVVKEAGVAELPVMVCKGVGDFDQYMQHEINGVVLDRENFAQESANHIVQYCRNGEPYRNMGKRLKREIMNRFSIDVTYEKYLKFLSE